MGKLPKYKITIDDEYAEGGQDLGIEQIAFTSNPAILVKGMAFKSAVPQKKAFSDNLKYRIAAPALIPMDIYRNDDDDEYYVQFTEDEIEKIHAKFMRDLSNRNIFNLEHDTKETVPAYILECWLVENPKEDKSFTSFGIEVPKGTLFVVSQITDEAYYTKLVEADQVGFSIEGFLGLKLSDIVNKTKNNAMTQMKKKLFSKTERPKFKFAKIADISVWNIDVDQDSFEVGTVLTSTWSDGTNSYTNPINDGQYYTEAGDSIFVDVTGKIVLVQTATEASTPAGATALSADAPKEEEVVEVAAADVPKEEEVVEPVAEVEVEKEKLEIDETELMTILKPKFDEIYQMIADLKAEASKTSDKTEDTPAVELSAHKKFSEVLAFLRKD